MSDLKALGKKDLTPEQIKEYERIHQLITSSDESDVPIPMVKERSDGTNEISVIGDPNKTEVVKGDYKMKFRMDKKRFEELGLTDEYVAGDNFVVFEREYKDVSITPRTDIRVRYAMHKVIPYYLTEEKAKGKELRYLTPEEHIEFVAYMEPKMVDAIYLVVGAILGLENELTWCMISNEVFGAFGQMLTEHPEIAKDANLFFDLPMHEA